MLLDPAETGAVTISLHQDVQGEAFDFPDRFFAPRVWHVARAARRARERARGGGRARCATARRPLIDRRRRRPLLARPRTRCGASPRTLGVPVAETSAGKGVADRRRAGSSAASASTARRAANELARDADVVICVGTRLTDFTTGSHSLFQHPDVALRRRQRRRRRRAQAVGAAPVVADAREALDALREALAPAADARPALRRGARRAARRWRADARRRRRAARGRAAGPGRGAARR